MSEVVVAERQVDSLEDWLAESGQGPAEWESPEMFDLSNEVDRAALEAKRNAGEIKEKVDPIDVIANGLFELHHPNKKNDLQARAEFVCGITDQGSAYGTWVFFSWSGKLVRYAPKEDHRALRTSSHRNLITEEEQEGLGDKTVLAAGMSVGSNGFERMVRLGIGGKFILGDMKHLEPKGLNRINGVQADIGTHKVDLMAMWLSELDPYVEQVHFKNGITAQNFKELDTHRIDIVVEEVDDLAAKAALRIWAQHKKLPVVTATDVGDRSLLDIERYDLLPGRLARLFGRHQRLFNGKIRSEEVAALALGAIDGERRMKLMMKIVGMRHLTPKLMESLVEVGETLVSIPQLGTTAAVGGSQVATAARDILLGNGPRSGCRIYDPEGASWIGDHLTMLAALYVYKRAQRTKLARQQPFVSAEREFGKAPEVVSGSESFDITADLPVLEAGMRAPTGHNTQPFEIDVAGDRQFDLYHKVDSDLPQPQGLLAYLNAGAWVRTLVLAAPNHGASANFTPELIHTQRGLYIGRLVLGDLKLDAAVSPLSQHITGRVTNRGPYYAKERLPVQLTRDLKALGNALVSPECLVGVMRQAGDEAWGNTEFVQDLGEWLREADGATDGIEPSPFNIPKPAVRILKPRLSRGARPPKLIRRAMVSKDLKIFRSAPAVAVLGARDRSPAGLFEAGQRLVDSWVTITGAGHAYHPFSGPVFFKSTVGKVAQITGQPEPVALYRVGKPKKAPKRISGRKDLREIINYPAA